MTGYTVIVTMQSSISRSIRMFPDKPHVLMMLERLIDHMRRHDGVSFCTLEDAAADYPRRVPFGTKDDLGVVSGLHV